MTANEFKDKAKLKKTRTLFYAINIVVYKISYIKL